MFSVAKSIDIDFAHHVHGHGGACINIHGHTWKFEVEVESPQLVNPGFVMDFKDLKTRVLEPAHLLLDHSFAIGDQTFIAARRHLEALGCVMMLTRGDQGRKALDVLAEADNTEVLSTDYDASCKMLGYKYQNQHLLGARQEIVGGMKIAVFPFAPTSELLAQWLYDLAKEELVSKVGPPRLRIVRASVYETLHPVEAVATYRGS